MIRSLSVYSGRGDWVQDGESAEVASRVPRRPVWMTGEIEECHGDFDVA